MTKRGGARPGSGRKSKSRELLIERSRMAVVKADVTPLEYLLSILTDQSEDKEVRFKAAVAAAPYVHPRLNAIEHKGGIETRSVAEVTDDELLEVIAGRGARIAAEEESEGFTH